MPLDSNIIIYAAKPEHQELRRLIARHAPAVSVVSYVEVLAATALVRGLQLLTANTTDFRWISELRISNPLG